MSFLIKGILIGLIFGIPVGAVGAMTVQRTFGYGFRAGLLTGLGSSAADCLYALAGVFGLTFVSDFMLKNQIIINVLGGIFILSMGIKIFFGAGILKMPEETGIPRNETAGRIKMFLSSFIVGIMNPTAVITFLFAFSLFGAAVQEGMWNKIQIIAGIFIGTYIWWMLLSAFAYFVKTRIKTTAFQYINKIFGAVLVLFGAAVFAKTFLNM